MKAPHWKLLLTGFKYKSAIDCAFAHRRHPETHFHRLPNAISKALASLPQAAAVPWHYPVPSPPSPQLLPWLPSHRRPPSAPPSHRWRPWRRALPRCSVSHPSRANSNATRRTGRSPCPRSGWREASASPPALSSCCHRVKTEPRWNEVENRAPGH